MKIEKIEKLKNGKYKLELEDGQKIVLYDNVILNNNILFKKEIDEELLNKIENDNNSYNYYNKVLNYISYKMRSTKDINQYMNKLDIPEKNQKEILDKLKNNNFINDNSFVKAYIADKINLTNDGPYKIKSELLNQDIDENLVVEELEKYNDSIFEQKIDKIISKKIASNNKYSDFILKQKILTYLINLGYSKDMILPYLDNINTNNENIITKEYNSLYKKLSKKYTDDKLLFEIKNRLIRKGFNFEEINNVIKKSEY